MHTGAKINILSKNSHIENPNFYKIHHSEISIFTKFTFLKSHFSQNSLFWILIFHKIHISKIPIFTIFTFLKSQFSQNSHLWILIFHKIHIFELPKSREFLEKKWVFAPVWEVVHGCMVYNKTRQVYDIVSHPTAYKSIRKSQSKMQINRLWPRLLTAQLQLYDLWL